MNAKKIDDGGPAFPETIAIGPVGGIYPGMGGMSLRDWFAGQALVGICAYSISGTHHQLGARADEAWAQADAMLRARLSKEGE